VNNAVYVTIIIVSYNTKSLLEECLYSIYKNVSKVNFEVIVVDNNSVDESPDMVKKKFPQVKLIINSENLGFAKANNQAIKKSKGEYILLLNSDTYCINNVIKKMFNFIEKQPKVGAIGIRLLNPDMTIQTSSFVFPSWKKVFFHLINIKKIFSRNIRNSLIKVPFINLILDKEIKSYLLYDNLISPLVVERLSGACMLIRREALIRVGLLDEKFFLYSEDTDLCKRIQKNGWKIILLPEIGIVHKGEASFERSYMNISPERYKGTIYYFSKHKGIIENLWIRMLFLIIIPFKIISAILFHKNNRKKEIFQKGICLFWEIFHIPLKVK